MLKNFIVTFSPWILQSLQSRSRRHFSIWVSFHGKFNLKSIMDNINSLVAWKHRGWFPCGRGWDNQRDAHSCRLKWSTFCPLKRTQNSVLLSPLRCSQWTTLKLVNKFNYCTHHLQRSRCLPVGACSAPAGNFHLYSDMIQVVILEDTDRSNWCKPRRQERPLPLPGKQCPPWS